MEESRAPKRQLLKGSIATLGGGWDWVAWGTDRCQDAAHSAGECESRPG